MEGHFDDILKSQDRYVKKIFPRISQELTGKVRGEEKGLPSTGTFGNMALKEDKKAKKKMMDSRITNNSIDGDAKDNCSQMEFESMMSMSSEHDFAADNAMDQIGITEIEKTERMKKRFS